MKKTPTARIAELAEQLKQVQAHKDELAGIVRADMAILCQIDRPQIADHLQRTEVRLLEMYPVAFNPNVAFTQLWK